MHSHLFSARTINQVDTGFSIIKITKFNQAIDHLELLIRRLQEYKCIKYSYTHIDVDADKLTIERDRIQGSSLDKILEYSQAHVDTFEALILAYRRACDVFDSHGFGFIITDYKELSNILIEESGEMQLIDFEDSFTTTNDRDKWTEYWDIAVKHSDLELKRITLLSKI